MPGTLIKSKKFLGITIYNKYKSQENTSRVCLGGFFSEKIFYLNSLPYLCQYFLLGLPLLSSQKTDQLHTTYSIFGGLLKWTINSEDKISAILNSIFSKFSIKSIEGKKHIYVLSANSGEIALFLSLFFERLLKKHGIANFDEFVVLCTKKYHQDMLKMYFPEVQSVVAKPKALRKITGYGDCVVKDWNIHVLFSGQYFHKYEMTLDEPTERQHFLSWMKQNLNMEYPKTPRTVLENLLKDHLTTAKSKLLALNLDYSNLIIIADQSLSSRKADPRIFDEVISQLRKKGYSIYLNEPNPKSPNFLTYPEVFALAKEAKAIIALRSGLVDFLAATETPCIALYTGFPNLGIKNPEKTPEEAMSLFSIAGLPYRSFYLAEIDIETLPVNEVVEKIAVALETN